MPIEVKRNKEVSPKDMVVKKLYQLVKTNDIFYINHVLMLVENVLEKKVLLIDLTEGTFHKPEVYFEEDKEALVRLLDNRDTLVID